METSLRPLLDRTSTADASLEAMNELTLKVEYGDFDPNGQLTVPNVFRAQQGHQRAGARSGDHHRHRQERAEAQPIAVVARSSAG
jgi:hypothetical protein